MQSGKNIRLRITAFLLSLVMLMGCITQLPASAEQIQAAGANQTELSSVATGTEISDKTLNSDEFLQLEPQDTTRIEHVARLHDEETLDTHVYLNNDGSRTLYFYDHPVQYLDAQGKRRDISLDIVDTTDAKYPFRTKANSVVTSFPASLSDGIKLSGNGVDLRLAARLPIGAGKNQAVRRLDSQTVSYTYDANTTIEYSLTYTGFKEDIVVNSYTGQTEYSFTLYTNGLILTKIADSYYLTDDAGTIRASIGEVIVFTADERNNALGQMRVETIEHKQQYSLTIVLNPEYLADPKTVYPIRIDPTITLNYASEANAVADVNIHSNHDSGGERTYLILGLAVSGISRILIKFPGIDFSEYAGVTITSATVSLRDLMCEGTQLPVTCHAFTGSDWEEATASWDTVTQSWGEALDSRIMSYSIGTTVGHWYEFNVKEAVQKWVDGDSTITPEKGFIFKADDTIENGTVYEYRTLGSYERSSYKPVFTMTYQSTITLNKSSETLYTGESLALTATTAPAGQAVTWSSDAPAVAAVDENGVVTGLAAGTATITAVLEEGMVAECEVIVLEKVIDFRYNINTEVYKGNTITLIPYVEPANEPITWTSLQPEIASVDQTGEVTGISVGVAMIRATLANGTYAECQVYVLSKDIILSHTNITLYTDDTQLLAATTVPPGEDVEWVSLNPGIATVSSSGVITTVRPGEATIKAIVDENTYAICTVTVVARQVILSETHLIMAPEENFYLEATTVPADQQVFWCTGEESVAIVFQDGRVVAIGTGSTYITASLPDGTTEGCYVEVVERELYVDMPSNNVDIGSTLTITTRTVPENRLVVWESSDPTIATVDQQGVVTGIKAGVVTIRAFMPAGPSISKTIYVTIEDGVYYISNAFSGYYLQTQGRSVKGFTELVQDYKLPSTAAETARIAQMWRITYMAEGMYTIRPVSKLDMCLYSYRDYVTQSESIVIYPHEDDVIDDVPRRAQWTILATENGYVIQRYGSADYCLKTVNGSGMPNAKMTVGSYSSANLSCHWKITSVANVPVGIVVYDYQTGLPLESIPYMYIAPEETRSIDVTVYPDRALEQFLQYDIGNTNLARSNNQYGIVTGIDGGITTIHVHYSFDNSGGAVIPLTVTEISNGTYFLRNKTTGCYADIDGQVMENNRTIHQWEFHGGNTQKWTFTHLGDGTYSIHSKNSSTEYYLGVQDDSSALDQDIVLRTGSITSGMKWSVTPGTDGAFILTPKTGEANNYVLATSTSNATNGAKLIQGDYISNNSYRDEWILIKPKYCATIVNYYDHGYHVRFLENENTSKDKIDAYSKAVADMYLQLLNLEISIVYPQYYSSPIDQCKGTVNILNINTICDHEDGKNHTDRDEVLNSFLSFIPRSDTTTGVLWTCHKIQSIADNGTVNNNRSCSWHNIVLMLSIDTLARKRNSEGTLMHELNHQYGAKDHYHELLDKNDENSCKFKDVCSQCSENGRPQSCVMNNSDTDINRDDIICDACKEDILTHLKKHHIIN